jgi:hypothetical protein
MSKIQEKIVSLPDQIKWVETTKKLIKQHGEADVILQDDVVNILQGIEENLKTTLMWINLPDYHRAAMHVLDKAFEVKKYADHAGITYPKPADLLLHLMSVIRPDDMHQYVGGNPYGADQDEAGKRIIAVAAHALMGVGMFIVPGKEVHND